MVIFPFFFFLLFGVFNSFHFQEQNSLEWNFFVSLFSFFFGSEAETESQIQSELLNGLAG